MDVSYVLDYPSIPAGEARKLHLLVRIETWPEEGGKERKPVNVAIVIDRSGSMAGEKLDRTKDAAISLVEQLTPQDVISVVTYSDTVEVPVPPTEVVDRDWIKAAIRGIVSSGNTNLSGGWLRGLSHLEERAGGDYLHRVLLLTDGLANRGVTEKDELVEIARQYQERGLATTTIGFGTDFNEDLLGAIAEHGGGRFHYVREPDQAPGVFLDEFGELARIFGQNLEVRIEAAKGVSALDVLGEERVSTERATADARAGAAGADGGNAGESDHEGGTEGGGESDIESDIEGDTEGSEAGSEAGGEAEGEARASRGRTVAATVFLGDIRDRDRRQVLAELAIPAGLTPGEREIATLHVAYDAVRGKIGRRQHVLPVTVAVAAEPVPGSGDSAGAEPDPEVVLEVVLHEIACMKRQAIRNMESDDYVGARGWLQRALRLVARHRVIPSEMLDRESKALKELLSQLERAAELSEQRKAIASTFSGMPGSGTVSPPGREERDLGISMRTYVMSASALRERLMARRPDVDVQKYRLAPKTNEVLEDIVGSMRETLSGFGHAPDFIDRAEAVTRELVTNALEHGCAKVWRPRVEVETRISRDYFKVVVEDNGRGFEVSAVIEEAEGVSADPARARGRGLVTVRRLADELKFNDKGNRAEAMLNRERFKVRVNETIALGPGGVGKIGVVKVDGKLDTHTLSKFESEVDQAVRRGLGSLILDLSNCRYISSAGIGGIMATSRRAEEAGGKLVIAGVGSSVKHVFDAMGLAQVLAIADSVDEARSMLESE